MMARLSIATTDLVGVSLAEGAWAIVPQGTGLTAHDALMTGGGKSGALDESGAAEVELTLADGGLWAVLALADRDGEAAGSWDIFLTADSTAGAAHRKFLAERPDLAEYVPAADIGPIGFSLSDSLNAFGEAPEAIHDNDTFLNYDLSKGQWFRTGWGRLEMWIGSKWPRIGAFTTELAEKLASIQEGAQKNVAPAWAAITGKPQFVPPLMLFRASVDRTLVAGLTNFHGEAVVSTDNSGGNSKFGLEDFVAVDKHNSDGVDDLTPLGLQEGDWMWVQQGTDYIIARIGGVSEDKPNEVFEFWFDDTLDEQHTQAYDQLGNGAGKVRFFRIPSIARLAKSFLLLDGTNATQAVKDAIQGDNEDVLLDGQFTRKTGVNAAGQWAAVYDIDNNLTGIHIGVDTDSDNDTDLKRLVKPAAWIDIGGWEADITGNYSRNAFATYVVFSVDVEALLDTSPMPQLNDSDSVRVVGEDVHRGQLVRQAYKMEAVNVGGRGGTPGQTWKVGANGIAGWAD